MKSTEKTSSNSPHRTHSAEPQDDVASAEDAAPSTFNDAAQSKSKKKTDAKQDRTKKRRDDKTADPSKSRPWFDSAFFKKLFDLDNQKPDYSDEMDVDLEFVVSGDERIGMSYTKNIDINGWPQSHHNIYLNTHYLHICRGDICQ